MSYYSNPFMAQFASVNRESYFFSDTFDSDTWTDVGSGIGVSGGECGGTFDRGTNAGTFKDMGTTLSDTAWIARCPLVVSAWSASVSAAEACYLGFSDVDANTASNANRDGLGIALYKSTTLNNPYTINPNGTTWETSFSAFTMTITTTTYYVEMKRLSATSYTINIYSDSAYSSLTESKNVTISSGVTGLRYVLFQNFTSSSSSNVITAHITEIFVKNGVTTW